MAAVRLSRLQKRMLRWLTADEQRTRRRRTRSHPELVAALPSAKGNSSHSLHRLEMQGLIVMTRTAGGKTASVSLTAAGRQKAIHITGRYEEGVMIERNNTWWRVKSQTGLRERSWRGIDPPLGSHKTRVPSQGSGITSAPCSQNRT